MSDIRYAFNVEWFDQASSLIKTYILSFYPKDNSIDMVESIYFLVGREKQKDFPREGRVSQSAGKRPLSRLCVECLLEATENSRLC